MHVTTTRNGLPTIPLLICASDSSRFSMPNFMVKLQNFFAAPPATTRACRILSIPTEVENDNYPLCYTRRTSQVVGSPSRTNETHPNLHQTIASVVFTCCSLNPTLCCLHIMVEMRFGKCNLNIREPRMISKARCFWAVAYLYSHCFGLGLLGSWFSGRG
jgi:hypothetical protein